MHPDAITEPEKERASKALHRAVKRAGSQALLGGKIRRNQQTISYWQVRGFCEAEAVLAIEWTTGVSRRELRPDLYDRKRPASDCAADD